MRSDTEYKKEAEAKGVTVMLRCILCAFDTELDDAVVISVNGRCICLRCFTRETNNEKPMGKGLRRELVSTLAAAE